MQNEVCFSDENAQAFAVFLAELVRQGVKFRVRNGAQCWFVQVEG